MVPRIWGATQFKTWHHEYALPWTTPDDPSSRTRSAACSPQPFQRCDRTGPDRTGPDRTTSRDGIGLPEGADTAGDHAAGLKVPSRGRAHHHGQLSVAVTAHL
jgi:hypothetical protein